jgi:hypothetical protein
VISQADFLALLILKRIWKMDHFMPDYKLAHSSRGQMVIWIRVYKMCIIFDSGILPLRIYLQEVMMISSSLRS